MFGSRRLGTDDPDFLAILGWWLRRASCRAFLSAGFGGIFAGQNTFFQEQPFFATR